MPRKLIGRAARAMRGPLPLQLILRQGLPLGIAAFLVFLMRDRLAGIDPRAVLGEVRDLSLPQWLAAIGATAASFWAVGRYDGVLHGLMGTGVPTRHARMSGAAAIALSQTLGFGVVTGSLVRWRLLPALNAKQAAALTALVAASFLTGWAFVTAAVVLVTPPDLPFARVIAGGVLGFAGFLVLASLLDLRITMRTRVLRAPSLHAMGAIVGLAALDTIAAGGALYVMMPDGTAPPLAVFLPAFLLALGAGLATGTPGGVGPFEVTLLALTPVELAPSMLCAIVAWRVVYYAIPALFAAALWLRGPLAEVENRPFRLAPAAMTPVQRRAVQQAPRAEAQLIYQGGKSLFANGCGAPFWMGARTGQSVVALGDPMRDAAQAIWSLQKMADDAHLLPAIYKCGARTAQTARKQGFQALRICDEAVVDPSEFNLQSSQFRQLRRKLRKAEQSGLDIRVANQLPLDDMARVNACWAKRNGGERGFSMGHFCAEHLSRQAVYLAYIGDRLVGFASFHITAQERTLDLMRSVSDVPDGTMHALVARAIQDASKHDCPRLSLAAIPAQPDGTAPLIDALRARILKAGGGAGLRQFKASFAPRWEPLYLVAENKVCMAVAGYEIARQITKGAPRAKR